MPKLDILFGAGKQEKLLLEHFSQMAACIEQAGDTFLKLTEDIPHGQMYARQIHDIEHRGDETVRQIFEILERSSFLLLDHEDIEKLAVLADSAIDAIWHAANLIGNVYELNDPTQTDQELHEFAVIINELYNETGRLFKNLRNLKRVKNMAEIIKMFHDQENHTDTLRYALLKIHHAAAAKDETPRQTVLWISWGEVYRYLEKAGDICVDITDILKSFQRKYWRW